MDITTVRTKKDFAICQRDKGEWLIECLMPEFALITNSLEA